MARSCITIPVSRRVQAVREGPFLDCCHAASLWTAAAQGSADAARRLTILLRKESPGRHNACRPLAAARAGLHDSYAVALLLRELRKTGADDPVTDLASRAANARMFDLP